MTYQVGEFLGDEWGVALVNTTASGDPSPSVMGTPSVTGKSSRVVKILSVDELNEWISARFDDFSRAQGEAGWATESEVQYQEEVVDSRTFEAIAQVRSISFQRSSETVEYTEDEVAEFF